MTGARECAARRVAATGGQRRANAVTQVAGKRRAASAATVEGSSKANGKGARNRASFLSALLTQPKATMRNNCSRLRRADAALEFGAMFRERGWEPKRFKLANSVGWDGMGRTLGHFVHQTWRSILSFFLSFVVLGLMVWFEPDWVNQFVLIAGQLKHVIMDYATKALGYGQPSALFGLLVGDTAIALTLITLFTRVIVLTMLLWLGSLIFGNLFGSSR